MFQKLPKKTDLPVLDWIRNCPDVLVWGTWDMLTEAQALGCTLETSVMMRAQFRDLTPSPGAAEEVTSVWRLRHLWGCFQTMPS